MTSSIRQLAGLGMLTTCVTAAVFAAEPTTDAARHALKKNAFSWYDSAKDDFSPLDPVKPPEPQTEEPKKTEPRSPESGKWLGMLQKVLMWAMLIAIIAAITVVAVLAWQDAYFESTTGTSTATISLEALEALPEPVRKIHDLLGEAGRQAEQSNYAAAMLCYFSWQLVQLDREQRIELQKGKTNRQYRRELSDSAPDLIDLFTPSIRLFEDAFFGQLPISRDDFLAVWDQRHRLEFKQQGGR